MTSRLPSQSRQRTTVLSAVSTTDAPVRAATVAWATMPGNVVDGGEIVLLALKPSMWRPLLDSASWILLTGAVAIALLWTGRSVTGLSSASSAKLVAMIGFARFAIAVARWIPTWYLLTNRRVIHVHGVRAPRIDYRNLLEVRNTYLQATPTERLCRLGSIRFVPDPADGVNMVWRSIAQPEEVHRKVRRAIENAVDMQGA